jgi:hypothetical protein
MTQLSSDVSKMRLFRHSEKARLDTPSMIKLGAASVLLLALLATLGTAGLAHAKPSQNGFIRNLYASDPAPQSNSFPEVTVIIVNGRTLAGPNSSAQQRGGRLFLPITSIARALGDSIQSDATSRVVTVRRQGGIVAEFNAQLNQVRENGSVTLAISATADIVFPPDVQELMLPVEIVAAVLDVSIQREEGRAIRITRGGAQASTVRPGTEHAPFELYQLEYDYNASRYTSFFDHNLTLRGSGRLGDGRFTFLTNFDGGTAQSRLTNLHGGYFRLERPGGQTFVVGDFGTGTDLQFMSNTMRGASAELPIGPVRLNVFAGRSMSGAIKPVLFVPADLPVEGTEQTQPPRSQFHYDTNVFGAYLTAGSYAKVPGGNDLLFSGGAMHFAGPTRRGDLATGSIRFGSRRERFQADLGAGEFSGLSRDAVQVNGPAAAVNLSGSVQLTDQLIVQGRYSYVGRNFLSAQSGLLEPTNLAAGDVTWHPKKWFTASLSASAATKPGRAGEFNRFETASLNLTPSSRWPTVFFSHTQSSTPQLKKAAFTLASAAKQFSRWRLFVNATRVKTFGPASLNAQAGANIRINDSNTFEISQGIGSHGLVIGTAAWQLSNLLRKHLSVSAGLGYMRSATSQLRTTENASVSVRLPRQSTLQFSYLRTQTGPTLMLSLRGFLFSSHRATSAISGPVAEVNSYGVVYGRVYQDLNLNGRYDPDVDLPQANVKVRVDGNRYVVTGADGNFRIDTVQTGEHSVYLDLLSVRADLTLLDGAQQQVALVSKRDSVVDFRLVRTGRISGVVWLDLNENGRLDEGEQPLADVRIVTGSGRDTMTDANGYFLIGDLPPGEHVVLVDEKTLPDQTRSERGSLSIKVLAGSESSGVEFAITRLPPEVKRFSNK